MKNICIVNVFQPALGIGGIETVSHLIKKKLKENGFSVWSLFISSKTTKEDTDIQFPETKEIDSRQNIHFFIDFIERHNVDIILLNGAWHKDLQELCFKVKRATKIKLIISSHSNPSVRIKEYDDYKEISIRKTKNKISKLFLSIYLNVKKVWYTYKNKKITKQIYQKYDIENIDAFITLSQEYTFFFQTIFPPKFSNKIHTIANPVVIENDNYAIKKENIVLFIGRLTLQKRLDRLLYIWHELQDEFPTWKLLIVGNGEHSQEYKDIANELQLTNIEFVGQQQSEEFFKRSKVICMTSSHEGLPMVLIEAQRFGCVPIAYDSFESAKEIVKNKYNGLLIKPFKIKEYKKALTSIMSNEELREQYARNGETFITRFDINQIIKKWITLFNNL